MRGAIGLGERVGNTQMDQMLVNLKLMGIAPWDEQDLTKTEQYCQRFRGPRACHSRRTIRWWATMRPHGDGVHAAASLRRITRNVLVLANTVYSGVPSHVFGLSRLSIFSGR